MTIHTSMFANRSTLLILRFQSQLGNRRGLHLHLPKSETLKVPRRTPLLHQTAHHLYPYSLSAVDTIASRTALVARHLSSSASKPASDVRIYPPSIAEDQSRREMAPTYSVRRVNQPNTLDYRVFVEKDGAPCSWFHDIPLYANEQQTILNMIVEIPRWTNAKLEVSRAGDIALAGTDEGRAA